MTAIHPSEIIQDVIFITPEVFSDERGIFVETYRHEWLPDSKEMIQSNRADRQAQSIVGLHYHRFQADYWYVPFGTARVVLHDLRTGSPTDGATQCMDLGAQPDGSHNHTGIYIPPGVAHGFAALTDMTITYLVDGYYNPADELGVAWNDPIINADWGVSNPVLSERDQNNPLRESLDKKMIPEFMNRA
ncbi:MAG: dTDP-4-dehydrorhamnose 3,5-epimerase [Acidimicrobiaceae bacterium]|jgi:dTDP-4-dehydrorhamnose 3,5-epimerase|nr:dTDP-4-dehydrorhamnose 3,5-epimerase [Acidimicrobiaceae bacterium]|tara:strand:+ start:130 stop:696 length:567 start_codon:yes stop_codon:yes gene_type:complete